MTTIVTRTTNPLPFHDLEPKRFEDLVRQLIYDFRHWRRLEATGRSGGDEGFDARGLEIVDLVSESERSESSDDEVEDNDITATNRLWLIQCKRERAIGPTKATTYLNEIVLIPEDPLYGLVFAAACDFSKKTRDTIINWCRTNGIAEVYVWGRGELEDMLFQPKNDNLLFAYFGISLTIRRRSLATQLRSEIATKRKLKRVVMTSSAPVLVRDPSAFDYPNVEPGMRPSKWWVYTPEELTYRGLMVSIRWHYAYIDPATEEWDAADVINSKGQYHLWHLEVQEKRELNEIARETWSSLPEHNRGWLQVSGVIPLRSIVAIDEIGDDLFNGTHIYVPFHPTTGPFEGSGYYVRLVTTQRFADIFEPSPEKRIEKFAKELRCRN